MGYNTKGLKWQHTVDLLPAPSAARTATDNGSAVDPEGATVALLKLDVTAASGTSPTLAVKIQGQGADGTWVDLATFTTATGVTAETKAVALAGRKIRATWTVGGTTPSFTFSVAGEARQTTTGCVILVKNDDALTAKTGTLHAMAVAS